MTSSTECLKIQMFFRFLFWKRSYGPIALQNSRPISARTPALIVKWKFTTSSLKSNPPTGIQMRKRAQKRMETDVFNQIRTEFNNYLNKKGHLGSLVLDHDAQTLQIGVTINGSDSSGGMIKDLKQLSGKSLCPLQVSIMLF